MPQKESLVEKIFSEPAELLEKGIEEVVSFEEKLISKRPFKVAGKYWNTLGPGLITGASDDDPSGIATYSQTGAQYGFQLLWLSWFTFPLMAVVQEMCARIGIVTGRGLAANIRHHYSKKVLYVVTILLFAANAFNIGADLGAMAQGVQLLFPHSSFTFLVFGFAILSLLLQIFTTYERYARYLKYLAFILLAYVFSALLSHLDWHAIIIHASHPSLTFSKNEIFLVCAILGTTISPYLFFWQTSQEVEERTLRTHKEEMGWHQNPSKESLKNVRSDVWTGMFFSNIVMFFIIAACAGTLYAHGITNITTAADAAMALRPIAGNGAFLLFALGIIGTGMLAIPVLAGSTSYAISECFGWKHGLYRKLNEAYAFYGIIIISMILGIVFNFIGLDPIRALIYSAVGNAIVAPIVLFFIVRLSSNSDVMRTHTNGKYLTLIGWITIWLMVLAGGAAIISLFL
ncbi:MAG: natural resistance-associated macrophage protein [Parcubacteria group bacterium]|nr:natural resistance-associated macrophage protein [Parcubacteria group bacterium]